MNTNHDGTSLYCSCCQRKKMGEISPDEGLVLREKRGDGFHHVAAVPVRELLERMSGTHDGSAILNFVAGVLR